MNTIKLMNMQQEECMKKPVRMYFVPLHQMTKTAGMMESRSDKNPTVCT